MGAALPDDVNLRLDLIIDEYIKDSDLTLRKLFSHYALSLAWMQRQGISEDYYEFCTEVIVNAIE